MEQTGLTSGTVYPALERLESLGLARSNWENAQVAHDEKRPPRRYFEITDDGERELIESPDRYKALAPLDIDGVGCGDGNGSRRSSTAARGQVLSPVNFSVASYYDRLTAC